MSTCHSTATPSPWRRPTTALPAMAATEDRHPSPLASLRPVPPTAWWRSTTIPFAMAVIHDLPLATAATDHRPAQRRQTATLPWRRRTTTLPGMAATYDPLPWRRPMAALHSGDGPPPCHGRDQLRPCLAWRRLRTPGVDRLLPCLAWRRLATPLAWRRPTTAPVLCRRPTTPTEWWRSTTTACAMATSDGRPPCHGGDRRLPCMAATDHRTAMAATDDPLWPPSTPPP